MRFLLALIALGTTFAHCGPPKLTHTGKPTETTRFNSGESPTIPSVNRPNVPDTVAVTGTEYLQVLGRNENGMYPALEGNWVLEAMPAGNLTSNSNNVIREAEQMPKGKPNTGSLMSGHTVETKEVKRESDQTLTTTSTTTSTSVYKVDLSDSVKKITPPQTSNYHNPEKPSISLFGSNETFSGFTGCNKIAGRYKIGPNNAITFRHSAPSTRMVCIGEYDEKVFINTLKRVNRFNTSSGQLQLMEGNDVLFVFARK